jgi:uncharacterized protein (TIRG00374 family)
MRRPSFETLILIFGAIAVVALISIYDLNGTLAAVSGLKLEYLLISFLMFFFYTFLKFLPWTYIIKDLNLKMSFTQSLMMMYGFFGMGVIPSSIGQFIPLRYLDRFRRSARFFSLEIILALGATSVLAVILLALIASILVSEYVVYIIALFAVFYVFVSLLGFKRVNNRFPRIVRRLLKPRKHKIFRPLLKYVNDLKKHQSFLSQKDILSEIVLFMPSLLAESAMLYFILVALNQSISFVGSVFIFSIAIIIGDFSFLPAGLGATDTTMVALMLVFGAPGVIAIAATIVFRFLNTFVVFLLGYASLLYLKFRSPKRAAL